MVLLLDSQEKFESSLFFLLRSPTDRALPPPPLLEDLKALAFKSKTSGLPCDVLVGDRLYAARNASLAAKMSGESTIGRNRYGMLRLLEALFVRVRAAERDMLGAVGDSDEWKEDLGVSSPFDTVNELMLRFDGLRCLGGRRVFRVAFFSVA